MTATTRRRGLTDRDHDVLRLLLRFRLLTGRQLQRLVVAEGSELTRARRTRAVLQRLYERKLVKRLHQRIGGVRAGTDFFIYQLTGRGAAELARVDGTARFKLAPEPGERFVNHVLAVSELYVQLVEAARGNDGNTLVQFEPEPQCWHSYASPHGGRIVIRPDAFVHTSAHRRGYVHFIEIDLATENATTIRTKCLNYIDYWRSGTEERRLGAFPRVLWVVPSTTRARQIESVIKKLPSDAHALFAVATDDQAVNALFGGWMNQPEPP